MIGVANLTLRLPMPLRDWLKERAKRNHRSANAELIALAEEAKRQEAADTKNPALS